MAYFSAHIFISLQFDWQQNGSICARFQLVVVVVVVAEVFDICFFNKMPRRECVCSTKMSQLWNVLPFVIIIFHNGLHPIPRLPLPICRLAAPLSCSGHVNSKIMIHYAGVPSIVVTSSKSQSRRDATRRSLHRVWRRRRSSGDNSTKSWEWMRLALLLLTCK